MDSYTSEILIMANYFVPSGCLVANGSSVTYHQYQALFALMQYAFGGDGKSIFMLPDLCGRVPIGMGDSARTNVYPYPHPRGEYGGQSSMTLSTYELPQHSHFAHFMPTGTLPSPVTVTVGVNTSGTQNVPNPKNNVLAKGLDSNGGQLKNFSSGDATPNAFLGGVTVEGGGGITGGDVIIQNNGQSWPFSIMPPFLAINYCVVATGNFPPNS